MVSRSGKLLSPKRGFEKRGTVACASSRLGETFSPKRDGLSLKIGARRLSDSSRNTWVGLLSLRRDPLAWARYQIFATVRASQHRNHSGQGIIYIYINLKAIKSPESTKQNRKRSRNTFKCEP